MGEENGNGRVKVTFRVDGDLVEKYDAWLEEQVYEGRSEALREAMKIQMEHDYEELESGLRAYLAGIYIDDPELAADGLDTIYSVNEDLGEMAEEYLDRWNE